MSVDEYSRHVNHTDSEVFTQHEIYLLLLVFPAISSHSSQPK